MFFVSHLKLGKRNERETSGAPKPSYFINSFGLKECVLYSFSLFPRDNATCFVCSSFSDGLCAGQTGRFVRLPEKRLRQGVCHATPSWR